MSLLRRGRQASVGLVVVALHLLGGVAWWVLDRHPQAPRKEVEVVPISVWLPGLPQASAEPLKRVNPPQNAPRTVSKRRDSDIRQHATDAALATQSAVATPSVAGASTETLPTPGSALNLTLSPKALTTLAAPSFTAQSQFHGRLPPTVERQVAAAFAESGPWTEERIDNDHIRFRRGSTCVIAERPRAAQIDPFSEASARIPWRYSTSKC